MLYIITLAAIIMSSYACASENPIMNAQKELEQCIRNKRAENAVPSDYTECLVNAFEQMEESEKAITVQDPDFFTKKGFGEFFHHNLTPERFAEGLNRHLKIQSSALQILLLTKRHQELLNDAKNARTETERNQLMEQLDVVTNQLITFLKEKKRFQLTLENTTEVYPEVALFMSR